MIVTPFSDLSLEDEQALEAWIDAHERRHVAETVAAKIYGGSQIRGPIDGDWMHRHWARTVALATVTALDLSSADTKALALPGKWRTQQELNDWMEADHRFHTRVDRLLGL